MSNLTLENLNERLERVEGKNVTVNIIGTVSTAIIFPNFLWNINEDKNGNEYYILYDKDIDECSNVFIDTDSIIDMENNSLNDELHISIWLNNDECIQIDK